jgi:phosphatidylglycerol:prolipoprotein diacylglycerol transferase
VHPVLFTVAGVAVQAYVALSVLGYLAGVLWGVLLGLRDGRRLIDLLEIGVVVVIGALLGSKLFHTLFEARGHVLSDGRRAAGALDLLRDDPLHWARLFESGYVMIGGVVGAVLVTWLFAVRRGIPDMGALGDYGTPGLLFGTFVGRIGCFLAGCCYGAGSDVPWAVRFPAGHPTAGTAVHPVQLYDAAYGALGLVLFAALYRRRRFSGEALCAYALSYAVFRFATETVRADADRGLWWLGLSTSQGAALVSVPVTLYFWRRALSRARATEGPR